MAESVVDYAAWKKGYAPPTEHVLIDKLSYRGARAKFGAELRQGQSWWIVTEGNFDAEAAQHIIDTLQIYVASCERRSAAIAAGANPTDNPEQKAKD